MHMNIARKHSIIEQALHQTRIILFQIPISGRMTEKTTEIISSLYDYDTFGMSSHEILLISIKMCQVRFMKHDNIFIPFRRIFL